MKTDEPGAGVVKEQVRPLPTPSSNTLKRLAQWNDRHNGACQRDAWYDLLEVIMYVERESANRLAAESDRADAAESARSAARDNWNRAMDKIAALEADLAAAQAECEKLRSHAEAYRRRAEQRDQSSDAEITRLREALDTIIHHNASGRGVPSIADIASAALGDGEE